MMSSQSCPKMLPSITRSCASRSPDSGVGLFACAVTNAGTAGFADDAVVCVGGLTGTTVVNKGYSFPSGNDSLPPFDKIYPAIAKPQITVPKQAMTPITQITQTSRRMTSSLMG